ncbi:MAG: phosphoribosylanthranilate isomerase [Selenomonadaceae bacterium]|nr:phosphoribosylanthranilate isomerase [Selenomonadaceae bacterium]
MTKVKFCGLSRQDDIRAANELLPDYIGFVFAPKSKRYVSENIAKELKSYLTPKIQAVGVFVYESVEKVANIANANIIDIIQLHGDEDEEYIKNLRRLTLKPIISALQLKTAADAEKANKIGGDYILLDAGQGEGKAFDWNLLEKVKRPYFLAGGLNEDNIADALMLNPFAVDVSSGIETDGKKDAEKMKRFIKLVRNK